MAMNFNWQMGLQNNNRKNFGGDFGPVTPPAFSPINVQNPNNGFSRINNSGVGGPIVDTRVRGTDYSTPGGPLAAPPPVNNVVPPQNPQQSFFKQFHVPTLSSPLANNSPIQPQAQQDSWSNKFGKGDPILEAMLKGRAFGATSPYYQKFLDMVGGESNAKKYINYYLGGNASGGYASGPNDYGWKWGQTGWQPPEGDSSGMRWDGNTFVPSTQTANSPWQAINQNTTDWYSNNMGFGSALAKNNGGNMKPLPVFNPPVNNGA